MLFPRLPLLAAAVLLLAAGPAGCQRRTLDPRTGAVPGTAEHQVTVGGIERRYLMTVPPRARNGAPVPVVFIFHGFGGSAEQIAREQGFVELARREGFVAVFPDGLQHRWHDGYAVRERGDGDDYAFVRAVLADVGRQVTVDPRRTFAAGHSNGAFFSQALACRMPGTFAAIAPVSGQLATSLAAVCRDAPPVSMLEIHGTADELVPFGGGRLRPGVQLLSVEQSATLRASRAGCATTPRTTSMGIDSSTGTSARRLTYDHCADGRAVELIVIDGGSHRWPGSHGTRGARRTGRTGTPSEAIDGAAVIWAFFTAHPAP